MYFVLFSFFSNLNFLPFVCLCVLVDRVTISPSTISTTTLSETILEHTSSAGSDISSPPLPNALTDTSHSSTLIGSPTEQQESPSSENETDSNNVSLDRLKEDENLNVKGHEDISEDVSESDKEKMTKEHNEKEQLSPPPESLREHRELMETDDRDSRRESTETIQGNTSSDLLGSSLDSLVQNIPSDVETPTPDNSEKMHSPWANIDSVAGSALREAFSMMDNLGDDSDTDSNNSEEDVIICDLTDNKNSEVQDLRGE